MTQEQLGEKADIDYKYLGGIERGERNIFTQNLTKIAKALEVTLNEFFVFEHELEDTRELKKNDELLKEAGKKEYKTIYRVIEAILK